MEHILIMFLQYVLITIVSCILHLTAPESSLDQTLSEDQSISGWTEPCITVDTIRHCYEIFETKSTWKNASDLCKHYGGDLVTIKSVEEQMFIEGLMTKRTFNASGLWIGSDKLHPEEQRAWANGEKFSYVNWAPGEPNTPINNENCVEIRTFDNTWNDATCAKRNGYICENSGIPCEIRVTTENETYAGTDAKVYIIMYGKKKDSGKVWLEGGEFKQGMTQIFNVSIMAQISPLTKLDIGHDNSGSGPGWFLKSVSVFCSSTGLEQVFPCHQWLAKDEGDKQIQRTLYEDKDKRKEREKSAFRNYIRDDNTKRWYKLEDTWKTWDDAFNICDGDGGTLLIIETAEEQTFIADQIRRIGISAKGLWIGSNKVYPERKRTWTDGKKFTYLNWAEGEPNNCIENCAEMYTSNRMWNDQECTKLRGFICEKTRLTEPCIKDETSGHCYQISDTKITWKKASDLCKHDGGNLVTIETIEEQTFIADLMKKRTFNASGLWIGSDQLHPEEQRAWANGKKFSYVNWAKGEPSSPLIDEDCVEIRTNDSTWNDVKCTKQNGYICENSDGVRNYKQDNNTGRWYKLVDELTTWDDAFNICKRDGGTLMIIETAKEQTFIADQIRHTTFIAKGLWIGSNKVHPERTRTWTDEKKFTYVNWAEDEPNNSSYVENCAEMYTSNRMWNDRECTLLKGFICEKTLEVTPYKLQEVFIIIITVGSALVIVVGVTILCCLLHKRNTCKKKRNETYQDVQLMEMNHAEHEYNRRIVLSDTYYTINDN